MFRSCSSFKHVEGLFSSRLGPLGTVRSCSLWQSARCRGRQSGCRSPGRWHCHRGPVRRRCPRGLQRGSGRRGVPLRLADRPAERLSEAAVVLVLGSTAGAMGNTAALGLHDRRGGDFHGLAPFLAGLGLRVAISVANSAASSGLRYPITAPASAGRMRRRTSAAKR